MTRAQLRPRYSHRLHVGIRQTLDQLPGPEQKPGDGRERTAIARPCGHAELARQGLDRRGNAGSRDGLKSTLVEMLRLALDRAVAHAVDRKTQRSINAPSTIGERRIVKRLLVEPDQP